MHVWCYIIATFNAVVLSVTKTSSARSILIIKNCNLTIFFSYHKIGVISGSRIELLEAWQSWLITLDNVLLGCKHEFLCKTLKICVAIICQNDELTWVQLSNNPWLFLFWYWKLQKCPKHLGLNHHLIN